MSDTEKRIQQLERKIEREKKARKMAEQQLEAYSLEIFQTNQSLQRSLSYAKKKQAELEYLGEASSEVVSEKSLKDLLLNTLQLTGNFFGALLGGYFVSVDGQLNSQQSEVWREGQKSELDPELEKTIVDCLPIKHPEVGQSWLVAPFEVSVIPECKWLVHTNFELTGQKVVWLVFLSSADLLDEESLFVLDTARSHLLSGIKRRLNDVKILKRTVELQDTVENLEQARQQLIQSEKMASLGQLAAGIAHEINNPIGYIRSNLEMLMEYLQDFKGFYEDVKARMEGQGSLDLEDFSSMSKDVDLAFLLEDTADLIKSNLEGVERVKDIVDGLKTFSHSRDDQFREIFIQDCVESSLKVAWNALKYDHKVHNEVAHDLPAIMGNIGQLQQVFVNFFVNAAQAMEEGGTLTVTGKLAQQHIVVEIIDTGCGMDQDTIKQLFTPFFTTKAVGVGTGLGLSVSYAILEAHNARIKVSSVVGEGTTFTLFFPI